MVITRIAIVITLGVGHGRSGVAWALLVLLV